MIWFVPLILACACAIVNPYVGFVGGTFCLALVVICLAFDVNVGVRLRMSAQGVSAFGKDITKLTGGNARRAAMVWKVATVTVCVATAVGSVCTWMVASMVGAVMTPVSVPALMGRLPSGVLLAALVVCLTGTVAAVFARCNTLLASSSY